MQKYSSLIALLALLSVGSGTLFRSASKRNHYGSSLLLESVATSLDEGDSSESQTDSDETSASESDDYGTYYYEGDDDSLTVDEMVNLYHSGKADYSESDAKISGGVEECEDCTSAVVPVGEYDEYVQYFTTEYDEYYLVKVPVTRHDVYTIREVPEVSHSVYYTTGDYVVQDQVTECDDCTSGVSETSESSSTDSESSSSSNESSSSSSSSTSVTIRTTSSESEEEDEEAEVDTTNRTSSSSNSSEETEEETEETSEDGETTVEVREDEDDTSGDEEESTEDEDAETEYYEETDEEYDEACEVAEEDITTTEVTEYDEYIVQEIEGGCEHCDDFLQIAAETEAETSEEDDEDYVDSDDYCVIDDDEITKTTVSEYDEYVVQEVEGGCDHCDEFLQVEGYPQLFGDTLDNDDSDRIVLSLVSPSTNTNNVYWKSDIYDNDETIYKEDKAESENPASHYSFIQSIDNPLGRDDDELPESYDDSGDDPSEGDLAFILVGSFEEGTAGKGKVVVVGEDIEPYTLISGLDKPVGLCFDAEHSFLYVADPTFGDEGYIYQFYINWDDDELFVLATTDYTIVYQGANPYGCSVDEYGNLYIVDATENKLNLIQYLDLWSGFTNYYITLYSRNDNHTQVNSPVGIAVFESDDIYFVNNELEEDSAVLLRGMTVLNATNDVDLDELTTGANGAWAVAVNEDFVYYTTVDSDIVLYNIEDKEMTVKTISYIDSPRGICYSDGSIFVADFSTGIILELNDDEDEEDGELYDSVEGAYALLCVNY
mmetsp:Transcript_8232/g.16218  ORF Transcript_8232/g.16218 Transcript_8232/m.16218 type:complete len:774 (+) Transcript_8232:159-2480(+)